jgi:hypothetical protein
MRTNPRNSAKIILVGAADPVKYLKSKAKQMSPSIRFLDRLSKYCRRMALSGLLGAAAAGLLGAHAALAQQPGAQHRHVSQPHSQQAHADQPHTPRAHVYLLRGLFNVFSLGMDSLAAELNRHGVETSVDNYADWQSLADRAAARFKAGSENPIILIGHSLGADAVMDMAAYLGRRDVPVALVIPFDGTKPLIASANVGRVVNLTQRDYAYARAGAGFHGSLANVDVSFDKNIDHITIDKAARTHARAISEVLAVVGHPVAAPKEQPDAAKPAAVAPAQDAGTGSAPPEKSPDTAPQAAPQVAPASPPAPPKSSIQN